MTYYILDQNGNVIPEPDLFKWAEWFEKANRIVKQEFGDKIARSGEFNTHVCIRIGEKPSMGSNSVQFIK